MSWVMYHHENIIEDHIFSFDASKKSHLFPHLILWSELVGDLPHDPEFLPDDVLAEHFEAAVLRQDQPLPVNVQGVPKKTLFCVFLAITLLWKGSEIKVGGVLKNSGNSLSDKHQNFSIWPIRSWENWV